MVAYNCTWMTEAEELLQVPVQPVMKSETMFKSKTTTNNKNQTLQNNKWNKHRHMCTD